MEILARAYAIYPGNAGDVIGKAIVDGNIMDVMFNGYVVPDVCYSITKYEVNGTFIFAEKWKRAEISEEELHKLSVTTFSAMLDGNWNDFVMNCAISGSCCGLNMLISGPMYAVFYSATNDNAIEGDLGVLRAKLASGDDLAKAFCILMEEGHRIYAGGGDIPDLMETDACKRVIEEFDKFALKIPQGAGYGGACNC